MKTPETEMGTLPNTDRPRIPHSEYCDNLRSVLSWKNTTSLSFGRYFFQETSLAPDLESPRCSAEGGVIYIVYLFSQN